MPIPEILQGRLRLPVIGAPMFIVSTPRLVLAQCKAGIVGSFPALNARPAAQLDDWLAEITGELAAYSRTNPQARVAPFAVNQIVHSSNDRLEHDVALCVKHRVPIIITSLRPPAEVVAAVHGYGGVVFHDVINLRHAEKAKINVGTGGNTELKAWRDIWSAGQSVSGIHDVETVEALVNGMARQYEAARARICP